MTQSFPFSDVGSLRHNDIGLIAMLNDVIVDDVNVTSSDNQISLYQLIGLDVGGNNGSSDTTAIKHLHFEKIRSSWQVVILCAAYLTVFAVSLSGNSLVCLVIYRTRRLHTVTNVFIANLAVSDLFITVVNVPFNVTRHLMSDWTFGQFTCGLVNFALTVFVYVSTLTMTAIAVDRYVVIIHPLRPRMSVGVGLTVVAVTWLIASIMSLPFAVFAQVRDVELFLYTSARCSVVYPSPSDVIERYVTVITFVTQYALPVAITSAAYVRIAYRLCGRTAGTCRFGSGDSSPGSGGVAGGLQQEANANVGQGNVGEVGLIAGLLPTRRQRLCHDRVRRRSIALLAAVVVAFTVSWLPLNLYHILTDFYPDSTRFRYNSTAYLTVHWVAISSVCCNPFAYCWMNASFRASLRPIFSRRHRFRLQNGRQLCRQNQDAQKCRHIASGRVAAAVQREQLHYRPTGAMLYNRSGAICRQLERQEASVRRFRQPASTSPLVSAAATTLPTVAAAAGRQTYNTHSTFERQLHYRHYPVPRPFGFGQRHVGSGTAAKIKASTAVTAAAAANVDCRGVTRNCAGVTTPEQGRFRRGHPAAAAAAASACRHVEGEILTMKNARPFDVAANSDTDAVATVAGGVSDDSGRPDVIDDSSESQPNDTTTAPTDVRSDSNVDENKDEANVEGRVVDLSV